MNETTTKGYIDAFLTVLIWSGFVIVSRIGGTSVLLPYDIVALRFGTAAIVLLPLWLIKHRVRLFQLKMLALTATGGIGYAFLAYLGFKYADAAHGSILLSGLMPFGIAMFGRIILKEQLTAWRIAGLASVALGVVCLGINIFEHESPHWIGDAAFITAAAMWGLYTALVRKWNIGAWEATVGNALLSAVIYLPIYILLLPKQLMTAPINAILLQSIYQGIIVVIVAMVLYMRAVMTLGASKVGLCVALVPAISGLGAALLLHEPLTLLISLGLAFTSVGAWLGNRR